MKLTNNHYRKRLSKKLTSSALVPFFVIGASTVIAADQVNQSYIIENAKTGKDWPTHGFDYAETRFSPLAQISADNVENLGLAWSYNLESTRGVEATPLVVDGVMYVTASWSIVHALDAKTGKKLPDYA